MPEYSLTRKITVPYFNPLLYGLGIFWIVLVTLLNIAAVGYESVNIYATHFNATQLLWYETFPLTKSLFPPSWSCSYPALISVGQSMIFKKVISDCSFAYKQQDFSIFGHIV
jgi:hypothetical protein